MTRLPRRRTARTRRRPADRVRAWPRLEGLEDRCLLSPTITEFSIPSKNSPNSITAGPDGNLWFAETFGNIGMINPATHAITEFLIPAAKNSNANPHAITAGPDGNLWFPEWGANKIGMINPATGAITQFPVPTASAGLYSITSGPDGNLWFTEATANKIGEINPATQTFNEFAVPTASASPEGITAGPDGNLWFAEATGNKIWRITTTGSITEFSQGLTASAWPWRIGVGPDGNLWFAEHDGNQIGMINPATGAIAEYHVPTANAVPDGISAGPDGNLWFAELSAANIGTVTPTGGVTEYPMPNSSSRTMAITAGPDGNVWFADNGTASIGVATLDQASNMHLAVTQQPPTSITAGSPFGLTAQVEDSSNNLVNSFNGTVTVGLANNPGSGTLGGTVTVAASNGVATFSGLMLTKSASGYTLYLSGSGPISTTTSTVAVTPLAPTQLVITQQPPATIQVNAPFTMKASIEDQYGNVVTTATGTVSVAFANNPTGATLGGTKSVTVSQGVASFTNLTINKIGSGYTLRVSSTGLTSVTSNPINVTKSGNTPVRLFAPAGNPSPDVSLAPLVLDSPDLWDGLRFKKRFSPI
jgi:virginiamycin B lyase